MSQQPLSHSLPRVCSSHHQLVFRLASDSICQIASDSICQTQPKWPQILSQQMLSHSLPQAALHKSSLPPQISQASQTWSTYSVFSNPHKLSWLSKWNSKIGLSLSLSIAEYYLIKLLITYQINHSGGWIWSIFHNS